MSASKSSSKVLIVDDDFSLRSVLSLIFEDFGYSVVTAMNGREALEMYSKEPFSLLITDYEMPELSGGELVDEVKRRDSNLPIVVISGAASDAVFLNMLRHPRLVVLRKPFDHQDLYKAITVVTMMPRVSTLRSSARFNIDLHVHFNGRPIGRATNLSLGGLFLSQVQVNSPEIRHGATVQLTLKRGSRQVEARCEVVWGDPVRGFGIRFVDPSLQATEQIKEILLSELGRALDSGVFPSVPTVE